MRPDFKSAYVEEMKVEVLSWFRSGAKLGSLAEVYFQWLHISNLPIKVPRDFVCSHIAARKTLNDVKRCQKKNPAP